MGRYSVTPDEKAATLRLAGWGERDGRWYRPLSRLGAYAGVEPPPVGQGYTLEGAFRIWRDEP